MLILCRTTLMYVNDTGCYKNKNSKIRGNEILVKSIVNMLLKEIIVSAISRISVHYIDQG